MSNFDIVLIGASAGGVDATQSLLKGLTTKMIVPIVILLHRTKIGKSYICDIFQKNVHMAVTEANTREEIRTNTIFVAPPDRHLIINNGFIELSDTEPKNFIRPSIDIMFQSAAKSYGSRVLGIILTGTGNDGTEGAMAVKAAGGVIIAQDKQTSDYFYMPEAAINSGTVDFILPLTEIPGKMEQLIYG